MNRGISIRKLLMDAYNRLSETDWHRGQTLAGRALTVVGGDFGDSGEREGAYDKASFSEPAACRLSPAGIYGTSPGRTAAASRPLGCRPVWPARKHRMKSGQW